MAQATMTRRRITDPELRKLATSLKKHRGLERLAIAVALVQRHYAAIDSHPFPELFGDLSAYVTDQTDDNRARVRGAAVWSTGKALLAAQIGHPSAYIFEDIVIIDRLISRDHHVAIDGILCNIDAYNKRVRNKHWGAKGKSFKLITVASLVSAVESALKK